MSPVTATTVEPPKACMAARTSLAGGQLLTPDQHLGAVLEVALGGDVDQRGRMHARESESLERVRRSGWIALDVANHALEHPNEALAAGVHHAGFLEHGHQLGRPGQGRLAFLEQAAA